MFVAALALPACSKKAQPAAAPEAPAKAETAARGARAMGGEASRDALAMAPPGGKAAVDVTIEQHQKRLKVQPDRLDSWVLLGRAWVRKARESGDPGYYVHADACADRALALDPESGLAFGLRAQVRLNEHKFGEARGLAERVLAKRSDDLVALGVLSDAALEMGRHDEAVDAAQRMVDLKPNLPSLSRASYLRWLRGDVVGAKSAALKAIDAGLDPRDPEPGAWMLVQAAMIFWHEGDVDGADAGFDRALSLFPDHPPALVGKGRVALARGDARRAVEFFAKADKGSPLVETAWLLGEARSRAGDKAGADAAFAEVERRGHLSDPRTLSLYLATKGREPAEAVRLAEEEAKERGDVYTHDALAWALLRAGRPREAKAASDKALALGTQDPLLLYHAAAIAKALGDAGRSAKLAERALSLNPHFDPAGGDDARALLASASPR